MPDMKALIDCAYVLLENVCFPCLQKNNWGLCNGMEICINFDIKITIPSG